LARSIVIDRWECKALKEHREGWLLVYGRRKTGKTWLLRNCMEWDLYAHVSHAGKCVVDSGEGPRLMDLDECFRLVEEELRRGGLVIVDEFQRLPLEYWDLVAFLHGRSDGLMVACGSSHSLVHKVFEPRSPLLGIFQAFHVDIASIWDAAASLYRAGLNPRLSLLWAPLVRDPWILAHLNPEGEPWETLSEKARSIVPIARGLVGEVFAEEGRSLTRTYEAVLELLAHRVWKASEIAHHLHAQGLISSPSPGVATGILTVLEKIGLVKGLPLWRTRGARRYYRHRSTLVSLLYRLSSIVDAGLTPSAGQIRSWYGVEAQFDIGELLARYHGLRQAYSILPEGEDIDVVLLDKKGRPEWGYEVKTGKIRAPEAEKALERIRRAGIPKAGIASLSQKPPMIGDRALGPRDLVTISLQLAAAMNNTW